MIYYVDQNTKSQGSGTKDHPFLTISAAAKVAKPGDEVLVFPGVYREYVDPQNAGTEDARITYRSVEPLKAVITGAEIVKGWKKYKGKTWVVEIDNGIFGAYNPYETRIGGDWYFWHRHPHTGCVYLNDVALYETDDLESCLKGEKDISSWEPENSIYKWYCEQKDGKTVIYANFQGKDPNKQKVEINVRRNCFFPSKTGVGYITLSGFTVNKAATTWAPPAAFQDGMIGPHWSRGWIIEDCEVSHSRCCGISLGKYLDPENDHYFTKFRVKSPTQMERDAVCRGQYHGWLRENIGSHIVRRCHIHHCEQTGIVGRMGGVFSIIEDNHIHNINNMMEVGGAEIAGIKMHAAIDVIMRRNHIHHCTMGIWCDWQAQGTILSQNFLHDNHTPAFAKRIPGTIMSQDIFVEVSHGPTIVDNNVMLSKASLRLATEGVAVVNNLICGTFQAIGEGTDEMVSGKNQPRYTPYHFPHRTEVMGFMSILHGDDRIYNNIFVQKWPIEKCPEDERPEFFDKQEAGTFIFDEYPTYEEWIASFHLDEPMSYEHRIMEKHFQHLPVWINGNVYFNGAKAWAKEENKLVVGKSFKARAEVLEKDGEYFLSTNVYEKVKDFPCGIINTDILGKAFQPDQRFENTDGSDILFSYDYYGADRGVSTIAGPFAEGKSEYSMKQ
ncbi:MAG: right-handed parallel beta-helix repeat-containing protein [Clostridiales bacterium]|nr:right-handed parallel beta-helix repeat-containing protein [Clostridiales bacterium]